MGPDGNLWGASSLACRYRPEENNPFLVGPNLGYNPGISRKSQGRSKDESFSLKPKLTVPEGSQLCSPPLKDPLPETFGIPQNPLVLPLVSLEYGPLGSSLAYARHARIPDGSCQESGAPMWTPNSRCSYYKDANTKNPQFIETAIELLQGSTLSPLKEDPQLRETARRAVNTRSPSSGSSLRAQKLTFFVFFEEVQGLLVDIDLDIDINVDIDIDVDTDVDNQEV